MLSLSPAPSFHEFSSHHAGTRTWKIAVLMRVDFLGDLRIDCDFFFRVLTTVLYVGMETTAPANISSSSTSTLHHAYRPVLKEPSSLRVKVEYRSSSINSRMMSLFEIPAHLTSEHHVI